MSMAVCNGRATLPALFCMGTEQGLKYPDLVFPVAASAPDVDAPSWPTSQKLHEAAYQKRKQVEDDDGDVDGEEEKRDGQIDIWNSIQESKKKTAATTDDLQPPYIHPLLRRSSSFLSQKSLEICTESLGSETGSDGFSSFDDHCFSSDDEQQYGAVEEQETQEEIEDNHQLQQVGGRIRKELAAVNYHCSTTRKSPARSFPPPLPSISRRDGQCLHMRSHRRNGRLVVHAVPVPSQNYLHCDRQDGRLLLSFIETSFEEIYPEMQDVLSVPEERNDRNQQEEDEEEQGEEEENYEGDDDRTLEGEEDHMEEEEEEGDEMVEDEAAIAMEEEEEEVEVVDRGIVVEVKVSRQPQLQTGGFKVHRSSLVINKFVGGTPLANQKEDKAAAVAVAPSHATATDSTVTTTDEPKATAAATNIHEMDLWGSGRKSRSGGDGQQQNDDGSGVQDNSKLLFSTKRMMKRQDLLHQVRRCSQNQRPLFIWEPCCVASS